MLKFNFLILFFSLILTVHAKTIEIIVTFTDGTPEEVFQVENMIGSIQEFASDDLRKYYRKENLSELQIYYDTEEISIIYAGDPKMPFLVEYEEDFFESYRMDECVEWFYEQFNKNEK